MKKFLLTFGILASILVSTSAFGVTSSPSLDYMMSMISMNMNNSQYITTMGIVYTSTPNSVYIAPIQNYGQNSGANGAISWTKQKMILNGSGSYALVVKNNSTGIAYTVSYRYYTADGKNFNTYNQILLPGKSYYFYSGYDGRVAFQSATSTGGYINVRWIKTLKPDNSYSIAFTNNSNVVRVVRFTHNAKWVISDPYSTVRIRPNTTVTLTGAKEIVGGTVFIVDEYQVGDVDRSGYLTGNDASLVKGYLNCSTIKAKQVFLVNNKIPFTTNIFEMIADMDGLNGFTFSDYAILVSKIILR